DGGNLLFDTESLPDALRPQWKIQSERLLQAHALLGDLLVTPGPKDFALGLDHLKKISAKKPVRWLSFNLRAKDAKPFAPSASFDLGKKKLRFYGYSSPELSYG